MRTYSPATIADAISNAPEDDSARAAAGKAAKLASVPASDVHELHAAAYSVLDSAFLARFAGKNDDERLANAVKAVQTVLSLHGPVQRSDANKNRANYRARSASSIAKGGRSTFEHYEAAAIAEANANVVEDDPAPAKPSGKRPSRNVATAR